MKIPMERVANIMTIGKVNLIISPSIGMPEKYIAI
jgi:hypothetical protein